MKATWLLGLHLVVVTLGSTLSKSYRTIPSTFSNSSIRIKDWTANQVLPCDTKAPHHTGWVDIGDRHLFFWFHEARNKMANAPLLVWFQGGPGGSSLHGMLYENGPCLMLGVTDPAFNPYSLTEKFNVVYLDQPAGVGFSYVDEPDNDASYHDSVTTSSKDFVAFIRVFYEAFPHLKSVELHLGGESYAGRYIPAIAAAVLDHNQFLDLGDGSKLARPIPLRSLMLGNPMFDPATQLPIMYDVSCYEYREKYVPHLDPPECQRALTELATCEAILHTCADSSLHSDESSLLCKQAPEPCKEGFLSVWETSTPRSIYDRRLRDCNAPGDCYNVTAIGDFLNSKTVLQDLLEVPSQSGGRKTSWPMLNELILKRFVMSGDFFTSTRPYLQRILDAKEQRVDVLVYVGVTDIICNADGVLSSLVDIHWSGRTEFRGIPWQKVPWATSGRVKVVQNLWMVEVEDAGHMVPLDQPIVTFDMVSTWLTHLNRPSSSDWNSEQPIGFFDIQANPTEAVFKGDL